MADYAFLFLLVLASQTLLTIVVLGIIYTLVEDDRKKKSKDTERAVVAVARECPHFFGYLAEQPENQSIIEECFGCPLAMDCKQAVNFEITIRKTRK